MPRFFQPSCFAIDEFIAGARMLSYLDCRASTVCRAPVVPHCEADEFTKSLHAIQGKSSDWRSLIGRRLKTYAVAQPWQHSLSPARPSRQSRASCDCNSGKIHRTGRETSDCSTDNHKMDSGIFPIFISTEMLLDAEKSAQIMPTRTARGLETGCGL